MINSLTTDNITNSDNITTKDLNVTSKIKSNSGTIDYITTKDLTLDDGRLNGTFYMHDNYFAVCSLYFSIVYSGSASISDRNFINFNMITGLLFDNLVIKLLNCTKEITNETNKTITTTYKLSVGYDIDHLMKVKIEGKFNNNESTFYDIDYIVGHYYSNSTTSVLYQYKTGYTDGSLLCRNNTNEIIFPIEHALMTFEYLKIKSL